MTYEEAIALRERASFTPPRRWTPALEAQVEQAVEIIARRHVETQRAEHPAYDTAVRRGGFVEGSRGRRKLARLEDANDYERCLEIGDDEPPPGWARP